VATVNLTRPEQITQVQLNESFAQIQAAAAAAGQQGITKRQILDMMIADILLRQAVQRSNLRATEEEINTLINQERAQFQQQNNVTFTDAQFRALVEQQTGMTWAAYREQVRTQIIQQKYLTQQKADMFNAQSLQPTQEEVNLYFRRNRNSFSNPEIMRIKHIFVSTQSLTAAQRQAARTRADEIYRRFQNGTPFEQLVVEYSDDMESRYREGDIGFLAINDPQAIAGLGQNFVDQVFSLSQGEVSRVIQSNSGFHIVKVTNYYPPKMLEINDPVNPNSTGTVSQYIQQLLSAQKLQQAFQEALESLVADLKAEAEITIIEANIN
jgi:parvulin-like peptidyl-prolyl isomerase